jgi:hypothetical protein
MADESAVHVMVDFQNVIPAGRSPRSPLEVQWLLEGVSTAAVHHIKALYPNHTESRLHLYGGWTGHDSRATRQAQWLTAEVSRGRTRRQGVRVIPRLATALQCLPTAILVGTLRPRVGGGMQQKMVDCMLALDASFLANSTEDPIVVWTDDDDLVPAAVSVAAARGICHLWRSRDRGAGLNDRLLERWGVVVSKVEALSDYA